MKIILYLALFIGLTTNLLSQDFNVFKTGRTNNKKFSDTIWLKESEFILLPVQFNGLEKNYMFDTGADLLVSSDLDSTTLSPIKINLSDINGKKLVKNLHRIENVYLNGIEILDMYCIDLELPRQFPCFSADGTIGNNLIKSLNWEIHRDYVVLTNQKIKNNYKTTLNTFWYGANGLNTKLKLNGINIDTCLIDYGGLYEISLPIEMYLNDLLELKTNFKNIVVKSSYGAHGMSNPDTVIVVNCNIDFNGIEMKNVNISFSQQKEKRIGILFLKRFQNVVMDNRREKIAFGGLLEQESRFTNYDFDLIDGNYFVKSAVIGGGQVEYGDTFVSINNKSSDSFFDYCEFLEWKKNLNDNEFLELITSDGKKLKIKNWH